MNGETTKDRLRLILKDEGLRRLDEACVMVIGLGGVGSNCAEALARGGVGNLVLLDRDVVAPSNVNRQAIAFTSTIGQPKADVMRKMVLDINPEARVTAVHAFLDKDSIGEQLGALPVPITWSTRSIPWRKSCVWRPGAKSRGFARSRPWAAETSSTPPALGSRASRTPSTASGAHHAQGVPPPRYS